MADYAKRKNDELATLCKERGLAHTGKKAELVKRLEDYDSSAATDAPADTTADAEEAAIKDTAAHTAASTTADTKPTQVASVDDKKDIAGAEDKTPAQDFSLGLEDRTLDDEIEKRKKRAAKFGLDTSQDETLKQLERAKRFGTTNLPGLLNQALPERDDKNKKRGRESKEDNEGRKRSRQRSTQDIKPAATGDGGGGSPFPKWMTAGDREAAERRKAKFSTA